MTTPAPSAPPSAFHQRPRQERHKAPERPFALVYDAFPPCDHERVRASIASLTSGGRTVTILRVREHMAGILPAADRPPVAVAPTLPPIAETVNIPGAQDETAHQAQHLARSAAAVAPAGKQSLSAKLARCMAHSGTSEQEETAYRGIVARWQDWDFLASANRYTHEDGAPLAITMYEAPRWNSYCDDRR